MYRYIAVDFDGTILNKDHKISEELKEYFKYLQKKGITIIPASGRNVSQMLGYVEQFDLLKYDTYIISDNGGTIHEVRNGELKLISQLEFTKIEVDFLNSFVSNKTKDFLVFNNSIGHYNKISIKQRIIGYKFGRKIKKGITTGASKVLFLDTSENIQNVYKEVESMIKIGLPECNVFRSVPTLIEVTPKGATKGNALQKIFEMNNFNRIELIAFGDGENDLDMISYAGLGVAMSNGFENVRDSADFICKSNEENGVYEYLSDYYSNKNL